ncbi:MAG: hypothetical protein ACKVHQ_07905 [Gammaproteobacteria bacterium]|jgi:hypothetical protein
MDNSEAIEILVQELEVFRSKSYTELKTLISDKPIGKEIRTYNDADYNVEIIINWHENPEGNIKVLAYVEDGEMRSFIPLTKSFIKNPDNEFIEN